MAQAEELTLVNVVNFNLWTFLNHVASGLPPIVNFAKPALRDRVLEDVFSGQKTICLAITEAFAGSDVGGLRCTSKRVPGGFIVTGTYVHDFLNI